MTTAAARPQLERATRDVAARGARIRFVEAGVGPAIVLIHDYLSSHVAWEDTLPGLAARFRVIAPDLPGFGESEKPPPSRYAYGYDAFAESVVDLLAALGENRVSLCGQGLGGAVALTVAANHPHLVDKLILVNPAVYPSPPDALSRLAVFPLLGPIVFKQLYGRAMFRRHFRDRFYGSDAPVRSTRVDYLFDLFSGPAAREAAFATMLATLDTRPLMAKVPRVTVPTLVVWGRADRVSPVEHGRRLARELQHARFEVFECGHSPPEECPQAFVEAAVTFLASGQRL